MTRPLFTGCPEWDLYHRQPDAVEESDGQLAWGVGVSRIYDREKLRAELAGKSAAAMVGTIRNDSDYARLVCLADEVGLKVSGWIARDAVKQADAILAELDRTAEDQIKAGGTE